MQPGEIVTPGTTPSEPPRPSQQPEPPAPEVPQQPTPPAPEAPAIEPSPEGVPDEQESNWQFAEDDQEVYAQDAPIDAAQPVGWTASEYVAHDKNIGWYLLVVLGAAVLAGVTYLITREKISPIVVVTLGIAFAAFGARKPRVLDYAIDNVGVHIGQRVYPYTMFKSFSVLQEDATRSILLMPLQRFNLPISIYYDPADEDQIIEALAGHLPHEDRQPGFIDNFMRKIRF